MLSIQVRLLRHKECGGSGRCPHGKFKRFCKECDERGLCKALFCETAGNRKYKGYCLRCFIHLFPDEPNSRNYKTKETTVAAHLRETFPDVDWVCDKRIEGGCSKRRPDLLFDMGSHVVLVEVDENQHDTYDCTCEHRRLMEIFRGLNHHHIAMIRFNPDGYICPEKGKIPTPCAYTKLGACTIRPKWKKAWKDRLEALSETVGYWMKNKSDKLIEVVELYY